MRGRIDTLCVLLVVQLRPWIPPSYIYMVSKSQCNLSLPRYFLARGAQVYPSTCGSLAVDATTHHNPPFSDRTLPRRYDI